MRRIKNKIKRSVRNWLGDCDMHNISLVIAGFFTLMLIGGISLIMFVTCIQIRKGDDIPKKDNAIESTLHTARYTRTEKDSMAYSRFCFLSEKYLYDPDCSNCCKHEQILAELPAFVEMQEKGILRVLAVYPDDNEEEWLLKSAHMPHGWIVGWNKQGDIRSKTLYEIRATPTMYLLDKQKKVILKDASLEQTIQYLSVVYPQPTK